jgi:hypothetical protein
MNRRARNDMYMIRTFKIAAVAAILALPLMAGAQTVSLSDAIRTEIMKDPRSSSIPSAQIDLMVASLAQAASQQGVNASDIAWRPAEAKAEGSASCDFLCQINAIFGFGGNDYTIPLGLGLTSAFLILFISLMLHRHHKHGLVPPTVESIHTHS